MCSEDTSITKSDASISNRQVLNAILYVADHACKWRGLPARLANRHAIYTRMNRWSKNGLFDPIFEHPQREQIARTELEAVSMNSAMAKLYPEGTGALQKKPPSTARPRVGWTTKIHMVAADARTAIG